MIRTYYFDENKRRIGSAMQGGKGAPPVLSGVFPGSAYDVAIPYLPDSALLIDPENQCVRHLAFTPAGTDENGQTVYVEAVNNQKEPIYYGGNDE